MGFWGPRYDINPIISGNIVDSAKIADIDIQYLY